jgi:hypothetical protein
MKDHKVIKIIARFDKTTCKRLKSFLESPYHNTSDIVRELGNFLIGCHPAFDDPECNEEAAFRAMFEEKPFSKHEFNRYMSKFFSVLERFIAVEQLFDSPIIEHLFLEDYYYKTNNALNLKKRQKATLSKIEGSNTEESGLFYYKYLNQKMMHNALMQEANRKGAHGIYKNATESLNTYYLIEIFQAATVIRYQHAGDDIAEQFPLLDRACEAVGQHIQRYPVLVQLWYYAYSLAADRQDQEIYRKLKATLKLNLKKISGTDARSFTVILNSALRSQTLTDRKRYIEERFDTYLIEIQEGWIIADNIIQYYTFNNIIQGALALGHIEWAEEFLEENKQYLAADIAETIILFNQAYISFEKKDYQQCMRLCISIPFIDPTLALVVKRLQIKCYFELEEFDRVFPALHAFTMYVSRLPEKYLYAKNANNLFTKSTKLLYKALTAGENNPEKYKGQVIAILDETPLLPEGEWLRSKIG